MSNKVSDPKHGRKSADGLGDIRAYSAFRKGGAVTTTDISTKKDKDEKNEVYNYSPGKASSYLISDYTWSEDYDPTYIPEERLIPIQVMNITEFQPDFSFQWGGTYDLAAEAAEALTSMLPGGELVKKAAVLALKGAAVHKSTRLQNQYISKPSKVVGMPIDFVKGLFAGTYINSFQVPFFNDTYLKANTVGNWSAGGAAQAIGEKAASIMKESMNVDFPTTPTWQLSDTATRDAISIEFYLINNSEAHLLENFKFLNSLISGTYWVQMDYIQKSPNVYDIEVPGRFHFYFAAMGVAITHVGKLRTNETTSSKLRKMGVKSITQETLFPDAYKLTIDIQDLCPNNFNNYADYLMGGSNGQVTVGRTIDKYNTNKIAVKFAGDIVDATKEAAASAAKAMFGG